MKKLIMIGGIFQTIFSVIGILITSFLWFFIATCAAAVSGIASGMSGDGGSGETIDLGLFGSLCAIATLLMFLLVVSGIITAVMAGKGKVVAPFVITQMVFNFLVAAFFGYLLVSSGNSTGIAGGIALAIMFMTPFVLYLFGVIAHFKELKNPQEDDE
jgi:hypothetical protein